MEEGAPSPLGAGAPLGRRQGGGSSRGGGTPKEHSSVGPEPRLWGNAPARPPAAQPWPNG